MKIRTMWVTYFNGDKLIGFGWLEWGGVRWL